MPCPGGCLYSRPVDRTDEFTNFAPRFSLVWRPVDGIAAYLALARGFRAPEVTELYRLQRQQSVADLDSEHVDAVELGLRWRGAGARINLAAYAMDKDNVILRDSAGFNVSDGKTRHRGIEYEFDWSPAEGWSIAGAGSYARHEYRFTAAVEQGEQITSGDDIDTAPRELHALRLRRETDTLAAELEWLHVGDYWANAANTARYGGHDLVNLRLSWRPATRLVGHRARDQPVRRRVCRPRGFRVRQLSLLSRAGPVLLRRARLAAIRGDAPLFLSDRKRRCVPFYTRGCCCVMQWMLPPPSRISRDGMPMTLRPGNRRAMSAFACRSRRGSSSGITTWRFAM